MTLALPGTLAIICDTGVSYNTGYSWDPGYSYDTGYSWTMAIPGQRLFLEHHGAPSTQVRYMYGAS